MNKNNVKLKEARPILVIRVPIQSEPEFIEGISKVVDKVIQKEYFTFILADKVKSIKFETYNVVDSNIIDLKKLKKEINQNLYAKRIHSKNIRRNNI